MIISCKTGFMTLSKGALPLFCLGLGITLGYGIGRMGNGVEEKGTPSALLVPANQSQSVAAEKAGSVDSKKKERGEPLVENPEVTPLGDQIETLLAEFNVEKARKVVASYSESEIQAALALTASLPKTSDRNSFRWELYRSWASRNPTAAWKAVLADPLDIGSGYLLGAVSGEIGRSDGPATIEMVRALEAGPRRSAALRGVFRGWGERDPIAAIEYWNTHPDLPVDGSAIYLVLKRLGATDPARAANLALKITDKKARTSAFSSVLSPWAEADPAAALKWAQSLTDTTARDDNTSTVLSSWARGNPKAAMAYVQSMPPSGMRGSAMRDVWQNWLRRSPQEAVAFIQTQNDEEFTRNIGWSLASSLEHMTQEERAHTLAQLPEGDMKKDVVRNLVNQQIEKGQYNQALVHLNNMPDSYQRDDSVHKLGKEWAAADPAAAAAWLKLQPDSSDRDLAVSGFATVLAVSQPREAMAWVDTIPDKGVRRTTLKNVAHSWLATDPTGAEAWLASTSELSDSEKEDARQNARNHRAGRYTHGVSVTDRR